MKRLVKLGVIIAFVVNIFTGCEQATMIRTASITEITTAGSDDYGVRITFAADDRFDGKGVDVQVKFSKTGKITMWQENQERFEYEILESDEWYSMTTIFTLKGNSEKANTEIFETHEKATGKTYLFNYSGEGGIEVTLRAVAGEKLENGYKTGEILVDSTPISDQFNLKIK